jgi:hypothetical protein
MNVFEERIINNNGNIKKFSRVFNGKDGIEIINDNGKISKKKIMYKPIKKIALLNILRPCKTLKRGKNSKKMDIAGRYLRKKKSNTRKKKKRKKKSNTRKRKKRKKKKRGFWGNFFDL